MAFVDVPGRFFYPKWDPTIYNMNNSTGFFAMSATTDYLAFVFTVPKTGTLNTVHLMQAEQTDIQDLHISFQNLDSNNDPDGTVDQFRVFTPQGADLNNHVSVGLITDDGTDGGVKRVVTQGDKIAVVIRFDSTGGDIDIVRGPSKDSIKDETAPYSLFSLDSGATWIPRVTWLNMMLEYETLGIVHIPDTLPIKDRNIVNMANTSTPNEVGFKFQVPFPCNVVGVTASGGGVGLEAVGIENAGGTPVAVAASAFYEADSDANVMRSFYFEEPEVTLNKDTDYYITWKPTSSTLRTTYSWSIEDAAARAGLPWGITSSYNTRKDGGAWTEDTAITMMMSLIISAVDDGAGGGGGSGCTLANGTAVIPPTCA